METVSKRQSTINTLSGKENATVEVFEGVYFFSYTREGNLVGAMLSTRGHKLSWHYRFKTAEERNTYIEKYKETILKNLEAEKERNEKYLKVKEEYQAGKVLVCSWGYEQTQVDFYLIQERKGETLTLVPLASERTVEDLGDRGTCLPTEKVIGEPFKKRLGKFGGVNLESYKYASLHDGKPKYWSSYY